MGAGLYSATSLHPFSLSAATQKSLRAEGSRSASSSGILSAQTAHML